MNKLGDSNNNQVSATAGDLVYLASNITTDIVINNNSNNIDNTGTVDSNDIDYLANHIVGNDNYNIPYKTLKVSQKTNGLFFPGMIMAWSGSLDDIVLLNAKGWYLCDGNDGRPDLSGRFVLGYESSYNANETGGEKTITLDDNTMPQHNHSGTTDRPGTHQHFGLYTNFDYQIKNDDGNNSQIADQTYSKNNVGVVMSINDNGHIFTGSVGDHTHSISFESRGSGVPFNKLPPYYVVAFLIYEG